jgi:DNA-binding PadR family transcriptional regulator
MSLSHAILVCIADEPMTGYELAKRFDSSVGFFWRANHQQIYRELGGLSKKGFVHGEVVAQSSRPNKTIFSITEAGESELLEWSSVTSEPAAIKEEFLLKFYALEHVDVAALIVELEQRTLIHQRRLALYEKILDRHYRDEAKLNLAARGKLIGLKAGLITERGWVQWCEQASVMLTHVQH